MALDVSIFHVHLDLTIMGLSVFAQIHLTYASLGSISMDYNVYIPKILARKEQDGMVKLVFLLEIALLDFIKKILLVSLSHKGAYLLLSGAMVNVLLELNALMEHLNLDTLASPIQNARMAKHGTLI